MTRGASSRMGYHATIFDTAKPFDYQEPCRNGRQKERNRKQAESILALVNTGMSMRRAAKTLGIGAANASLTLKRYRANFLGGQQ